MEVIGVVVALILLAAALELLVFAVMVRDWDDLDPYWDDDDDL